MKTTKNVALVLLLTGFVQQAWAQSDWSTETFSGFTNVTRVEITADFPNPNPAMDNIVTSAGTMDFESVDYSLALDEIIVPITPFAENGLNLTNITSPEDGAFGPASPVNNNGTSVFGWCGACGGPITIVISADGDAPFDLTSIDFALLGFDEDPAVDDIELTVEGYFAGGGVIGQQVTVFAGGTNNVPVNSTWMILLMALGLALVGGVALRARA